MPGVRVSLVVICACAVAGPGLAAELADPTQPPQRARPTSPAASSPARWDLSLVRLSDDDRSAVLNGKLVREGDRVGAARVVRIETSQIVLEQGGRRIRIALAGGPVKSPPRGGRPRHATADRGRR